MNDDCVRGASFGRKARDASSASVEGGIGAKGRETGKLERGAMAGCVMTLNLVGSNGNS
jgi:hypothetical protein